MSGRPTAAALALAATAAVLACLAGLVASVATAPAASAHAVASSLVRVQLAEASTATTGPVVRVVGRVPLQEIDAAYDTAYADQAASEGTASTVAAHEAELAELVADRVGLASPGGEEWPVEVTSVGAGTDQGQAALRIVLTADGPASAPATVDLTWGLVTDVVVTHDVYVGAVDAASRTELVGTLTRDDPTTTLTIDDPGSAAAAGAGPAVEAVAAPTTMWAVGWHHFREGADHLLFLSLVALGVARRRDRWAVTARRLGLLTLVFTVGHSLSLAASVLGWVSLPSRWVEVAIAATIVAAAVHVARPRLSWRAEVAVTGVFGLVHGLGFAGTLRELSLRGTELVTPLLTFNLGLEAAQLAALALVVLPLLVLARSRVATVALAGAVGVVAVSWVVERAVAVPNPLQPALDVLLTGPERLALLLALAALAVLAVRGARRRTDRVAGLGLVPPVADTR